MVENARQRGFRDFSFILKENDFNILKNEPDFIALIEQLGLEE
jgi:hypothetical protein